MRFFLILVSLLFMCCGTEKMEKKVLNLCKPGIDSLLQHSWQSSNKMKEEILGKFAAEKDVS